MTLQSTKPKQFKVLTQTAYNQAHCCMTIFQSVAGFLKVEPREI